MNISFYTLGCKVNQYETRSIAEQFKKSGYTEVPNSANADVFLVNSCTVTAESDRKTRQMVRRFRKQNPQAILILAGCMPQAFPEDAKCLTEADIIVGNTDPAELPELVTRFMQTGERIIKIGEHKRREKFNTPIIEDFGEHTRAFMKIEDGCDRYCTYCIIPSARGDIRSKSTADIRREAALLADSGYSEIVLVGINLSSYGKDSGENLCDAVDAAGADERIKRIRLGSLEPDLMSDEMLARLAKNDKFCPQFHLALQSGCDDTLKRMNRHYDTAFFYDLVKRIRASFNNAAITTDIMVGFAGETEDEFNQSLDFVKKVGFSKSHIFAYSKRAGTMAANLKTQVSAEEKQLRSHKMAQAAAQSEKEFLRHQVGKICKVLFETLLNNVYSGYTENYTPVKVESDTDLRRKIFNVKITSCGEDFVTGEVCER